VAKPGFNGRYAQHITRRWAGQLASNLGQHISRALPVLLLGRFIEL
jgi:hypothetical protein